MKPSDIGEPDMIIIPGTKSTIADFIWLRESGLEAKILQAVSRIEITPIVFGICGGFQMLGEHISDPEGTEAAELKEIDGMGLLPIRTVFEKEKVQKQVRGRIPKLDGALAELSGIEYKGYEIHMGRGDSEPGRVTDKSAVVEMSDIGTEAICSSTEGGKSIYGTYVHGIFDAPGISDEILKALCNRRGIEFSELGIVDVAAHKEEQYNILAKAIRESLDMNLIYRIMNGE